MKSHRSTAVQAVSDPSPQGPTSVEVQAVEQLLRAAIAGEPVGAFAATLRRVFGPLELERTRRLVAANA